MPTIGAQVVGALCVARGWGIMAAEVDVLLPFHRVDKFLEEAVQSIRGQVGVKAAIILVDDQPEASRKPLPRSLLRASDTLLTTEGGRGYGEALRVASSAITAEAMALMNSDDISLPQRLARQLSMLDNHVVSNARITSTDERLCRLPSLAGVCSYRPYDSMLLLMGSYGADASWCCRSNWWQQHAFFDPDPALDWRIGLRSLRDTAVGAVPTVEYLYRKHQAQITRTPAATAFDRVFEDWSAFNSALGLPDLTRSAARTLAAPWERSKEHVNIEDLGRWLHAVRELARCRSLLPEVDALLKRRMTVRALSGPDSLSSRLRWAIAARTDIPHFILEATRVVAAQLRAPAARSV